MINPDFEDMDDAENGANLVCSHPDGHVFRCTGTAYGGEDTRWNGEGRCLCIYCGADGDA
jgi:hypothetical protein